MKIISGGKKDYYDYLVSKFGIDEDIVYDRRDSYVVRPSCEGHIYFCKEKYYGDKPKEKKKMWHINEKGKRVYGVVEAGLILHFVLEIGYSSYLFQVERYLNDSGNVVLSPSLEKKLDVDKKSKHPISIIPCDVIRHGWITKDDTIRYDVKNEISNPILSSTFIPSFIDAEEVYNEIYNYLISIREKPIIDNRNDILKLESFGFDKKTSFRNPVYNANNKKYRRK